MIVLFIFLCVIICNGQTFSDLVPDDILDIGVRWIDNYPALTDVWKNNLQIGHHITANADYLVYGTGLTTIYGAGTVFSYNSTANAFNELVFSWYSGSHRGAANSIAKTNNNIILHVDGNTGFGVVTTGTAFSSAAQKSFAGNAMECTSMYPCDNVGISPDGALWVYGWPNTLTGSGASGQRGFIRFYTCAASSTCTPKETANYDGTTTLSYHAGRGRDQYSYHGHSITIGQSVYNSANWMVISSAPGNTDQDNEAIYPTYDYGGNNGDSRYGGYVQTQVYQSGLARVTQRVWAPDGNAATAVNNKFGSMVRVIPDGTKLVITAIGAKVGADTMGAFYVYENNLSGLASQDGFAPWKGPYYGPVANEKFGWSVFVTDDASRIFIGAPDALSGDGKIYVYNYDALTEEYVLQGNFISGLPGEAGGLGSSIYYDQVRDQLHAGIPNAGTYGIYTSVGMAAVYSVPAPPTLSPTQSPTPPTLSPTPAPTPPATIVVGKAEIKYNVKNGTARATVAKNTVTDVKSKYANPSSLQVKIKSTETSITPLTVYNQVANKTKFEISYAKARGCYPDCTAVATVNGRRILTDEEFDRELQSGGNVVIQIVFDLTEQAYDDLIASGNNLDDPGFLTDLASELGVSSDNITVTVTGGEVIVEVSLIAQVNEDPSGSETLADLQEIQASLDNATSVLVQELGTSEDSVTTVALDLCGSRDCNGHGIPTAADTDENGCNTFTGVCVCESGWWGINCESACECFNDGYCVNGLCQCDYPYYGLRCHKLKNCTCT